MKNKNKMDIKLSLNDHLLMCWDFFCYLILPPCLVIVVIIFTIIGIAKSVHF